MTTLNSSVVFCLLGVLLIAGAEELEKRNTTVSTSSWTFPESGSRENVSREGRVFGFLSGLKLGSTEGVGTLTTSNSFRILGKVVNYALSVSYGDAYLPPTGPTGPFPGPGPFPGSGPFPIPGPFPNPGVFPGAGAAAANDEAEQIEGDGVARQDKSRAEFEDYPADVEPITTTTTTTATTTTQRPTTKKPVYPRTKFREQREHFLKQHNMAVMKFNSQLQKRRVAGRGK